MPTPREVHRGATRVLSALMVLIGIALLARSLAGGVWLGLVIGILFVAAGAGRLYLTIRGGR